MPNIKTEKRWDLSGGIQKATTRLFRKQNEVEFARNVSFSKEIGGATRRDGYEQLGNTHGTNKEGLGAFVHRYSTGDRIFKATNNSGDTFTVVSYVNTGTGAWTDLITDIAANTRLHSANYLNELFLAGVSDAGDYMTLRNIDNTPSVSTTRNLTGAPRAKYITEYGGLLYAINVEINVDGVWTKFPNRAYRSSAPLGAVTFVKGDQSGSLTTIAVDSVRYLKVGMIIDIYTARTNTKIGDSITITAVDKALNKITIASTSLTLKHRDEIWAEDRKGKETIFWNTDYPTVEDNDEYLEIPPGEEGSSSFTGGKKYNNRLFLTTEDSTIKWDSQNLITVNTSVGTSSHESLAAVSGWLIIPHRSGQIWAYNDNSGDWKLISRGMKKYLKDVPQSNWAKANSLALDNVVKISLGSVTTLGGRAINAVLRAVYDFDMNNWTMESHTRQIRYQFTYTLNDVLKPYFQDSTGRLLKDETGNLDLTATIPMEFNFGRSNLGLDEAKEFIGCTVYSDNWQNVQVGVAIDGMDFVNIGELSGPATLLTIPDNLPRRGNDIDFQFAHNENSDAPQIMGVSIHYSVAEQPYAVG